MKISVVGAGQVGGQAAFLAMRSGLGDVVLFDVNDGLAQGKALDIGQSMAIISGAAEVCGGADWSLTEGSDIIVVTAGLARRPGMNRQDLLTANGTIVTRVVREALRWSPDALVIVVTNPINTMTYLAYKASGLPPERVFGMAGILDNARLTYFISRELAVPVTDIVSWVIGDHGDHLVPVLSQTRVDRQRLTNRASPTQLERISARTRNAGTEILNHLREGSAYFAPGAAICKMLSAIARSEPAPMPCSVYLQGEYGVRDVMAGVPAVLGRDGVKEIVELELASDEYRQFAAAVAHIRERNAFALPLLL
ncbi:MAG: malate dehydrogenase [Pseudomonadota bacterium]